MSQLPFRQQLEKHNQPEEVRQRLAAGEYNPSSAKIAQEYLDSIGRSAAASTSARAEARAEEALAIDKATSRATSEAAASAPAAARWAMWAAIIALIAVAIANKDQILALIFGNL